MLGAEVPGVDVGVTAEGGVHDVWLGVVKWIWRVGLVRLRRMGVGRVE